MKNKQYKVSVWMITYNHEKFITQAIDSVLMQNVNFDYNIVIGEDCSTDNTRKILLEYKNKYPDKFKLLLHDKNIGITQNMIETYKSCEGEYIAMLEGDDYWIDKNKLQTQVNYLENNKDCVLCYTKVNRVSSDGKFLKSSNPEDRPTTGLKEILSRGWFMHTGTLLYRNNLIKKFPDFFFKYRSTDYMLHVLLATHGKIGFIDIVSSSYREHLGGITNDFRKEIIPFLNKKLCLLDEIDGFLNYEYSKELKKQKKDINASLFIHKLKSNNFTLLFSGIINFVKGNKKTILNRFFLFAKKRVPLVPKPFDKQ